MLASLNFVEKFISLPKKTVDVTVNGKIITKTLFDTTFLAPILTKQGFEVENIIQFGGQFDSVIVGRIERFEKHPEANRLNICFVNVNEGAELRQIVCGAKNVREGMFVAVALSGAKLPVKSETDVFFEIKSSVIRNVKSDGMLCARSELGLSVNADVDGDGIWDLADDAQGGATESHLEKHLGYPVFMTVGLEDTLLELSVTPNRADMLCQNGIARELAAGFRYNDIAYELKSFSFSEKSKLTAQKILNDAASHPEGECGHIKFEVFNYLHSSTFFVLLELTQEQKHTPAWLRNLLEPINQNSINLIVDVSNFILVAYGQPNHTFDLDAIDVENPSQKKLVLRHAHAKEFFVGLDGKERYLNEADCVVSDSSIPQALLGVVGGAHSKIKKTTRKIAIEFANPNSISIRHTARRHSKHTVASFMFEKGIDSAARFYAAAEFIALLSHVNNENVQYCTSLHSKNLENKPIVQTDFPKICLPLHQNDQKKILGVDLISFSKQVEILTALGFEIKPNPNENSNQSVLCFVPSWRTNDVIGTADLVEEFIRVVGIDHVPAVPMDILSTVNHDDLHLPFLQKVSNQLCALGYHEVIGLNFMRADDSQKLNLPNQHALGTPVTILNPVLGDEPLMQTTLIPDLLRKVERNLNYGIKSGQLFTTARTFVTKQNEARPQETRKFAGVCFGDKTHKTWQNSVSQSWTIHDVMMHVKCVCEMFNNQPLFKSLSLTHGFHNTLHPKKQVEIFLEGECRSSQSLGWLGELHPKVKRNYGLEHTDVYLFEINFEALLKHRSLTQMHITGKTSLPRFPLLSRDFSFILSKDVSAQQIEDCVKSALFEVLKETHSATLKNVQIFDIYHGENMPENKKSVTFKVIIAPEHKTFTEQDIQIFSNCVTEAIAKHLGGEQRL